jgi:hypothetical protein
MRTILFEIAFPATEVSGNFSCIPTFHLLLAVLPLFLF